MIQSFQCKETEKVFNLAIWKYVKILHAGDSFTSERISKYREKGVEDLYFKTSDRKKFIRLNNYVSEKIIANKDVAVDTKMKMVMQLKILRLGIK